MALIPVKVMAEHGIWYPVDGKPIQKYTDPTTNREKTLDFHKLWGKGEVLMVDEKHFSDYDVRTPLYGIKKNEDGSRKILDWTQGTMRRLDPRGNEIVNEMNASLGGAEPLVVADGKKEEI